MFQTTEALSFRFYKDTDNYHKHMKGPTIKMNTFPKTLHTVSLDSSSTNGALPQYHTSKYLCKRPVSLDGTTVSIILPSTKSLFKYYQVPLQELQVLPSTFSRGLKTSSCSFEGKVSTGLTWVRTSFFHVCFHKSVIVGNIRVTCMGTGGAYT